MCLVLEEFYNNLRVCGRHNAKPAVKAVGP
jgi:hypothetical protein